MTAQEPANLHNTNFYETEPNHLLHRAADASFHRSQPRRGPFSSVTRWYTGQPDGMTQKSPRYCNGRLKRWQFILLNLAIAFFILSAILIPVFYFVIIPQVIRDKINGIDVYGTELEALDIYHFQDQSVQFALKAAIPPQFPLPLKAQIAPFTMHIKDDQGKLLTSMDMSGLEFQMNEKIWFDPKGTIRFSDSDKQRLEELIREFSSDQGLGAQEIVGEAQVDFGMFGIAFYRNFAITKRIPLPALTSNMLDLFQKMPKFVMSNDLNNAISEKYPASDLIKIHDAFPSIRLQQLKVSISDVGPFLDVAVEFENPLKISVNATDMEAGLAIDGVPVARLQISNIQLVRGLQVLSAQVQVHFDDPTIDYSKLGQTISNTLSQVLFGATDDLKVALVGPIRMKTSSFTQEFTTPLALYLPMKEMLKSIQMDEIKSLLSADGIKRLIKNSTFSADITSTSITIPLTAALPKYIPLPEHIVIPSFAGLGIYGQDQHTVSMMMSPIEINTNKDSMKISTTVTIHPNNTVEAAVALADFVNPLLSTPPKGSSIRLRDVVLSSSEKMSPYAWCSKVFDDVVVSFDIPPILSVPELLDVLTSGGMELPLSVIELNLKQLLSAPGFAVDGSVALEYPPDFPDMSMNLGFAQMRLLVQDTPVVTARMPQGLVFRSSQSHQVALNAEALVERHPDVAAQTQRLVNAMMSDVDPTLGTMGVTGLVFGPSAESAFVTFSRVIVTLDVDALLPLIKNIGLSVIDKVIKPGLIQVGGADVAVETSARVQVGAIMSINNPLPVSAAIGSLRVGAYVDNQIAANAQVGDVVLEKGASQMNLESSLIVSDGSQGLADNVARLVEGLLMGEMNVPLSVGGIRLVPPGVQDNHVAVIDQFESMKVNIPPKWLNYVNPLHPDCLLDMSALLPDLKHVLSSIHPSIHSIMLNTVDQNTLASQVDVSYTNPIPMSASLPFAALDVQVDAVTIAQVQLSSLALSLKQGRMNPLFTVVFNRHESVPALVAALVESVFAGTIRQHEIIVKGVIFGSSASDSNDILSKIQLNLDFIFDKLTMQDIKPILNELVDLSLPLSLNDIVSLFSPQIRAIEMETLKQRTLACGLSANCKLPFTITTNIGYFNSHISLDDRPFVDAEIRDLIMKSSSESLLDMQLLSNLQFVSDSEFPAYLARLVNRVLAGQKYETVVRLKNIRLGQDSNQYIDAFSQVVIPIHLDEWIQPIGPIDLATVVSDVIAKIAHDMIEGDSSLMSLDSVVMALRTGKRIEMSTSGEAVLPLPFKIKLNLKHLAINTLMLDSVEAVKAEIRDFVYANPSFSLESANLYIQDSESLKQKVAELVRRMMRAVGVERRDSFGSITVGGASLGASADDMITAFSGIVLDVPIDSFVKPLVPILKKLMEELKKNLSNLGNSLSEGSLSNQLELNVPLAMGISVDIKAVDLVMLPQRQVSMSTHVRLNVPFKISLSLPYFAMCASLDEISAVKLEINGIEIKEKDENEITLGVVVSVWDSEELSAQIAHLVSSFIDRETLPGQLRIHSVSVGTSAEDSIEALQAIDIRAELDMMAKPIAKFMKKKIQEIWKRIEDMIHSMDSLNLSKRLVVDMGYGIGVALDNMAFELLPKSTMKLKLDAEISFPMDISLSVPYFTMGVALDKVMVVTTQVDGFKISPKSHVNTASLTLTMNLWDEEPLADKLGEIAQKIYDQSPLSENLVLLGLGMGQAANDYIKALEKVELAVGCESIVTPIVKIIKKAAKELDLEKMLESFGFKLSETAIQTLPGKTLSLSSLISLTLPFPVNASIGFMSFAGGLDFMDILHVQLSDLYVAEKNDGVKISGKLIFLSSLEIQQKVAAFAQDVFEKGLDQTTGVLSVGGCKLGVSETDYIRAFSKIQAGLSISKILNKRILSLILSQVGLNLNDLSLNQMLERLVLKKAYLDASPTDVILAGVDAGLNQLNMKVAVSMGFVAFHPLLNNQELAHVRLPVINMYSSKDAVLFQTDAELRIVNQSAPLKQAMATTIEQVLGQDPITSDVGVSGFLFGRDKDDVIDTFALVRLRMPLDPIIKPIKDRLLSGNVSIPSINWSIDEIVTDIAANNVFWTQCGVHLPDFAPISIHLPYVNLKAKMFGDEIANVEMRDIKLVEGRFSSETFIHLMENPVLAQKVLTLFSNLLFWRPVGDDVTVGVKGMAFGASPDHVYDLAEDVAADMDVTNIFKRVGGLIQNPEAPPIKLRDIGCEINYKGLDSHIVMNPLPDWLNINWKIGGCHGKLSYQMPGTEKPGYMIADAYFYDFVVVGGKPLEFGLLIMPRVSELVEPLKIAVPRLLKWEDYAMNAKLGYADLMQGDPRPSHLRDDQVEPVLGHTITILNRAYFDSPDLYLWQPIRPSLGWDSFWNSHGFMNFLLQLRFPNPGPLTLNMGKVNVSFGNNADGKSIFKMYSQNEVVVYGKERGGEVDTQNKIALSFSLFNGNPVWNFFSSMFSSNNLQDKFIKIILSRPDGMKPGPIVWMNELLSHIPVTVFKNILSILFTYAKKLMEWPRLFGSDGRMLQDVEIDMNSFEFDSNTPTENGATFSMPGGFPTQDDIRLDDSTPSNDAQETPSQQQPEFTIPGAFPKRLNRRRVNRYV